MASCVSSVLQHVQVTVIKVADEQQTQLPPITRSRAASLAGAAAAAAEGGSASVSTGSRFGFIRDLARRRSKAGSGSAAAAAAAPVWASIDGGDSQTAPLLEYELQSEVSVTLPFGISHFGKKHSYIRQYKQAFSLALVVLHSTHDQQCHSVSCCWFDVVMFVVLMCLHANCTLQEQRRSQSVSGMHLTANTTLTLSPIPKALNPAAKQHHHHHHHHQQGSRGTTPRAAGAFLARQSSEGEGLIPVGHYNGSSSAAAEADDSDGCGRAGAGVSNGSRPLLDVGFVNISMTLKSCGKQVLQGITGALVRRNSHDVAAYMQQSTWRR
jgi:hypothetical protein